MSQLGQRGASLLELITLLALTGVLAGAAISSLHGAHASLRLRHDSVRLLSFLDSWGSMAELTGLRAQVRAESVGLRARLTAPHLAARHLPEHWRPSPPVRLIEFRFGALDDRTFTLRPDGSATPGHLTLEGAGGRRCRVVQALRGPRRIDCDGRGARDAD